MAFGNWYTTLDLDIACPNCPEGHLQVRQFERQNYTQPVGMKCHTCQYVTEAILEPDGRIHAVGTA